MRLVVVDHRPLFREGVALILGLEADLSIVGSGESAEDAVRLVSTLLPDIVLFDLNIPGGGLQVLQQLRDVSPATNAIIFASTEDESTMLAAMRSGARGYVLNTVSAQQLAHIIREVHAGASYVSHQLAMRVLIDVANSRSVSIADRIGMLSEREYQILAMVSKGASNRQIDTALNRTEAVIKNQMTVIMKKLQVNNRVQAAMVLNHEA
jgi:DNA-binding NarL/FixJ family response regulator